MPARPSRPTVLLRAWAATYAGFALGCLALRAPVWVLADHRAPAAWNLLALLVAVAAPVRRAHPLAVLGAAASGFGLLMDLVVVAVDQRPPDGAAFGHHALGFAGLGIALAVAAWAHVAARSVG